MIRDPVNRSLHCGVNFRYCSKDISSATYFAKLSATFVRQVRNLDSLPLLHLFVQADQADQVAQPARVGSGPADIFDNLPL